MAGVGRRAPLANIPNATNSPHRILTSGSKRTRTQANISLQENEHPHKRLAVDKAGAGPTTPIRYSAEGRVFERGTGTTGSNAFQKRLVAARDRTGLRVTKNVEPEQPKDEALRRWQEHYRKAFPSFSFYFDAVNDADRGYFAKDVLALGAVCSNSLSVCVKANITIERREVFLQVGHSHRHHPTNTTRRWRLNRPRSISEYKYFGP